LFKGVCSGRDRMVVRITTTCAISVYHHLSCEFESRSWRGVLDATACDKMCIPPRCNWNIVESGINHHNLKPIAMGW